MKNNTVILKIIVGFLFISILIINSCQDPESKIIGNEDYRFEIHNISDKDIYIDFGYSYPDTSIGTYRISNDSASFRVCMNDSKNIMVRCCWEDIFETEIQSDTLMVFIFDANDVENIEWDSIKSNYRILKRLDLTLEEIQMSNWLIVYPD